MGSEMLTAAAVTDAAQAAGAECADARLNRLVTEDLTMRNGALELARSTEDLGVGLRVLVDGCWGFAAEPLDGAELSEGARAALARRLARLAVRSARSLSRAVREPVRLAAVEPREAEWRTPVERDPFGVPLDEKVALLLAADASMEGAEQVVVRESNLSLRREEQWHATSEGARLYQELVRSGAGISATASAQGRVQRRSHPSAFGGNFASAGWEHVLAQQLPRHGARVRDEAVALCSADPVPPGRRDLILGGSQLMLQIHESVGHPNELDRVFGHEVDLAGSSFATTEKLGTFRYGSEVVNLVADSTVPGGLDTRGFDDDGVPSGRWHVVRDGVFRGYHTSREWARRAGESESRGTNRAEGWYNPPIIRITNLSLMPGTWTLDDLIADTREGIYADTVKMWSIDQRRLNFQFTTEIAWEIRDGRRTRLLRDCTYQGTTPEFWRSCDAVCDERHWQLWGVANCGKGNPMQVAEMSHGCAPARFRAVTFL